MNGLELTAYWLLGFWTPVLVAAHHLGCLHPHADSARASLDGTTRAENTTTPQKEAS